MGEHHEGTPWGNWLMEVHQAKPLVKCFLWLWQHIALIKVKFGIHLKAAFHLISAGVRCRSHNCKFHKFLEYSCPKWVYLLSDDKICWFYGQFHAASIASVWSVLLNRYNSCRAFTSWVHFPKNFCGPLMVKLLIGSKKSYGGAKMIQTRSITMVRSDSAWGGSQESCTFFHFYCMTLCYKMKTDWHGW